MNERDGREVFLLDGEPIPFAPGQTVMQAALAAGHYIPHLCFHHDFKPHGSCKVCTVRVDGATTASCTPGRSFNSRLSSMSTTESKYASFRTRTFIATSADESASDST